MRALLVGPVPGGRLVLAAWLAPLLAAAAVLALARGGPLPDVAGALVGAAALAMLVAGLRRHGTASPVGWGLVGLAQVSATAAFLAGLSGAVGASSADAAVIASTSSFLLAGVLLLRRMELPGARAPRIEAVTASLVLLILLWALADTGTFTTGSSVLEPGAATTRPAPGELVQAGGAGVARVLLQLAALPLMLRLAAAVGHRDIALAGPALAAAAVAGTAVAAATAVPELVTASTVRWGVLLPAAVLGAAALRPRAHLLVAGPQPQLGAFGLARLGMLAVAGLTAPTVLVVQSVRGDEPDVLALGALGSATVLLILARLGEQLRLAEQARNVERVLRSATADLVAAPGTGDVERAAVDAMRTLLDGVPGAVIALARRSTDEGWGVVAATDARLHGVVFPADGRGSSDLLQRMLRRPRAFVVLLPVPDGPEHNVLIALVLDAPLSGHLARATQDLAGEVTLALQRADLSAELGRRDGERRFARFVENTSDYVSLTRADAATLTYVSPAAGRELAGFTVGADLRELLHRDDREAVRRQVRAAVRSGEPGRTLTRLRDHTGRWRMIESSVVDLRHDPDVGGFIFTGRDITERVELERRVAHQATYDALTGLCNRGVLLQRLGEALDRAAVTGRTVAVLVIDLDDFKTVNDSLGHALGDRLLVEVVGRMRSVLRDGDLAARVGGDEFAVVLPDTDEGPAAALADRLIDALQRPVAVGDRQLSVSASIGLCLGLVEDAQTLLRQADTAVYAAKRQGKHRWRVFEPSMHTEAVQRLARSQDLREALEDDQIEVHLQPIVSLRDGRVSGFEALARWQHPTEGLLGPQQFIPLAEETGLIVPLGRDVLRKACRAAASWPLVGAGPLSVSVNVSARQLLSGSLVQDVLQALADEQVPPTCLQLEVTESLLVEDVEAAIVALGQLRAVGVRIAIDDFGTGYSSLSYLQRLPLDALKLDKSFVDALNTSDRRALLPEAVLALSQALELVTIAEGVEGRGQQEALQRLGCELAQGWRYARPLPPDEVVGFLGRWDPAVVTGDVLVAPAG